MISCFLIPAWKDIIVFFLKAADTVYTNAHYVIVFLGYDFNYKNEVEKEYVESPNSGIGIFFRGFHLRDRYAAFIYFKDKYGQNLYFYIGELNGGENNRYFSTICEKTFWEHWYAPHVNYNEFFKVNENRIVFVTNKYPYDVLYFFISL